MFVCCYVAERLTGAIVRVGDDPERNNPICGNVTSEQIAAGQKITIYCDWSSSGQYVSIGRPEDDKGIITLCEVEVFGKCIDLQLQSLRLLVSDTLFDFQGGD